MKRLSAVVAVSAGVLAIGACTDATGVDRASSSSVNMAPTFAQDASPDNPKGHIHELKGHANGVQDAGKNNKPGSGTGISYHGGPVLQAGTNVVAVYWAAAPIYSGGPAVNTSGAGTLDGSLIGFFLRHLGGSPYFGINSTYTNGSGQAITNSVSYTSYWANGTSAPSGTQNVSDAQMISMLQSGFNSHAITYDPSTLYVIFTAGKVNLGGGFGSQYCGYHWNANVSIGGVSKVALYAALPYDYAYPGSCTNGTPSPNNDPGADGEVSVLTHEIEETTTDMMGNAWYDSRGYENADKCAWTWGTSFNGVSNITLGGKNFLVQQNWKNTGTGGCAMHI